MTVLFACVQNAGRSQMAAALFNRAANGKARAVSAGTRPAERVHPVVTQAMAEIGLDVSNHAPQRLTPELAQQADVLITMGCGDECPYVPGLARLDWALDDPKNEPIETVRVIRDQIAQRVNDLIHQFRLDGGG